MFKPGISSSVLRNIFGSTKLSLVKSECPLQLVSDVESLLAIHSFHIEDSDEELTLLVDQMEGPEEAYSHSFVLKDKGNSLFKEKNFQSALNCYKSAVKLLCLSVPRISEQSKVVESLPGCNDLVISLHLNLAVCELKLGHYQNVVHFCSLVLKLESKNVKALFRRGCAYVKLGQLEKASDDFKQVMSMEPNNKDVQLELSKIKDFNTPAGLGIGLNEKGRRKEAGLNSDSKSESLFNCHKSLDKDSKKRISSCAVDNNTVSAESQSKVSLGKGWKKEGEEKLVHTPLSNATEQIQSDRLEMDSNHNPSKDSPFETTPPKKEKMVFINKKRPSTSLRLSREDVERLRSGKELQFFNSHSLTFLKVRTFQIQNPHPIKMDVKMEAHLNHESRVAEVSGYEASLSDCCLLTNSSGHIISHDNQSTSSLSEKVTRSTCPSLEGKVDDVSSQVVKCLKNMPAHSTIQVWPSLIEPLQKGVHIFSPAGCRASIKAKKRAMNFARRKNHVQGKRHNSNVVQVRKRLLNPRQNLKTPVVGDKRKCQSPTIEGDPPLKKLVSSMLGHNSTSYPYNLPCISFVVVKEGIGTLPYSELAYASEFYGFM